MKLKNVLCIATLSAVVALTGVPQSATALVHAEETQIANLDETLRQMYALYQNEDYSSMVALDISVGDYAKMVRNNGSDRYVVDLDSSMKAMIYVTTDGGYWWYFGQMENNLRQGHGTTIAFNSVENYDVFTGNYIADSPNGSGTYSSHWYSGEYAGERYDISGNFQGMYLNGNYQVNTIWFNYDRTPCSGTCSITYENNHVKSVDTATMRYPTETYESDGNGNYLYDYVLFYADNIQQDLSVQIGYEPFAIGFTEDGRYHTHFDVSTEYLNAGLPILKGNSDVSAIVPASSETQTHDASVPTTETLVPAPTAEPVAATNTYVVERGDNLSKIAAKIYGDSKYWRNIYTANSNMIKKDYVIYANQVLTIPEL